MQATPQHWKGNTFQVELGEARSEQVLFDLIREISGMRPVHMDCISDLKDGAGNFILVDLETFEEGYLVDDVGRSYVQSVGFTWRIDETPPVTPTEFIRRMASVLDVPCITDESEGGLGYAETFLFEPDGAYRVVTMSGKWLG